MKTSEIVKALLDDLILNGDRELKVDLLTENQSNLIDITGIASMSKGITIDCDINDLREFKKNIK